MQHRLRRIIGLGMAAAVLAGLAIAAPASAVEPIHFRVGYNYYCAGVIGTPGQTGTFQQLDATGAVIQSFDVTIDPGGEYNRCFDEVWHAGMKARATLDGVTRTVTLPKLGVRINRATDVVSGVGPAGKVVTLYVTHWTSFTSSTLVTRNKTISADGTFSKDYTTLANLIGGDLVSLYYTSTAGDQFSIVEVTPLVEVWIGRPNFGVQLLTGTGGKVTLRNSAGTFRGAGYAMYPGFDVPTWDYELFQTKAGTPITARIGDKVSSSIPSNMAFTIPNLTLSANATTNVISGSCPANRKLRWTVYVGSGSSSTAYVGAGVCSAAGTYSVDLTPNINVAVGQPVEIVARLGTGDLVARKKLAQ